MRSQRESISLYETAIMETVQEITGQNVKLAFVDQGYTGRRHGVGCRTARYPAGGGEACRSETRLRPFAQKLGTLGDSPLYRVTPGKVVSPLGITPLQRGQTF